LFPSGRWINGYVLFHLGRADRQFELEEDVFWNEKTGTFDWVFGQQTEFHLIKPRKSKSMVGRLAAMLGWNVVRWI